MSYEQTKTPVISMHQFYSYLGPMNFTFLTVDTDPGVDDTIAMLFPVLHPRVRTY